MLGTKSEKSGTSVKKLQRILRNTERHWVGDGFPVRTLFVINLWIRYKPFPASRFTLAPRSSRRRQRNATAWVHIRIVGSRR